MLFNFLTFLAVVLVVMQSEAVMTGTLVGANSVLTEMLAPSIVQGTLIFI